MSHYKDTSIDLSNCDKEPIHLIGRIQPHGFLLILDPDHLTLEQASRNIGDFLHLPSQELQGNNLRALCADEAEYDQARAALAEQTDSGPLLLRLQGQEFFGFTHLAEGRLVLECEPFVPTSEKEHLTLTRALSRYQSAVLSPESLQGISDLLVDFVWTQLGYDRVLLYVFDEHWNGEVTAERVSPGTRSYLHHHFPASDIPAPARALLAAKPIRMISDASALAVEILPYANPRLQKPLNLLHSELRSASEIHLEYLQNMEVAASLSLSVIVENKLWGVVTCHHARPKTVNLWCRQAALAACRTFAATVPSALGKRDMQVFAGYLATEKRLVQQVVDAGNLFTGFTRHPEGLLELTEGQGAALCHEGQILCLGTTPSEEQVRALVEWLSETGKSGLFCTNQLPQVQPEADAYRQTASGLLALELARHSRSYVLFFKPEQLETRIWAGKPDKVFLAEDMRIHPRKSFAQWEEKVRGKSRPWTLNEQEIGRLLQKDLVAVLLRLQSLRLVSLNAELRNRNKRLEDFSYTLTHNLRSPINNIKGLYAYYKSFPEEESALEVLERMHTVVENMAGTIDDLNLITEATLAQPEPENTDLALTVQKVLQNLQSVIKYSQAQVHTDLAVGVLPASKAYLESIVHNLLSNAVKYRSPDRPPQITVRSWAAGDRLYLAVSDNGLGLDLDKVKDKLFGLYRVFHRTEESKGLGLYLTKMQVEALNGTIDVESQPGHGTTFTVSLERQSHLYAQEAGAIQDA